MTQARNWIQQAEECLARGATLEAAKLLGEASRIDPFDAEPPLLTSMVHMRDGRYGEAATWALQSLAIRPFHPAALNLLAVICADAGYRAEGLRILRRLERDAPGLQQAKRNQKQIRRARDKSEPQADFPIAEVRAFLQRPGGGLSVCIATADGRAVHETIDSVREVADQIVVLDATSRSDARLAIEDDDVEVVHSTPTTDRAALLNAAIRQAREAWVLVLKPGETLERASVGKLRQALEHGRTLYHEVRVADVDDQAVLSARLFRNAPGLAYAGCVLPSIRPALVVLADEWRLRAANSGVTLRQAPHVIAAGVVDTGGNDLAACCTELKEYPQHPALILQLARVASAVGDAEKALQALAVLDGSSFASAEELTVLGARCSIRLEQWADARMRIESHHAAHPSTRNTLYLLGAVAGAQGDAATAARALSACAAAAAQDSFVPLLPEIRSAALPNLLGAASMDLGHYDEAQTAFESALHRDSSNAEARMGLLSLHLVRGDLETMLQQLDAWVDAQGDDPKTWFYGSVLLGRIPELAEVNAQWTREAMRRFSTHPELRKQGIAAQMGCGQIDAALDALRDSTSDDPSSLAAQLAASLAAGAELPHVHPELRPEVESGALEWLEQWMLQQRYDPLDRALVGIAEARLEWPGLARQAAGWLEQIGQAEAASRIRQENTIGAPVGS